MATSKRLQPAGDGIYTEERASGHQGSTWTTNRTARLVGFFFLFSNVTFLAGSFALVEPILTSPDYLTLVSASTGRVVLGVFLELLNAVAYLGIAALMFPLLRRRFESLALLYVGFRFLEAIMQTLSDLSPLSLLTLSEEFVQGGGAQASALAAQGTLLLAQRFWAFQMVSVTFSVGALLFYYMLYHVRLIPRWLSVWGLIGATAVLTTTLLDMSGINIGSLEYLGVLMLLNELVLGVWLIARGFQPDDR